MKAIGSVCKVHIGHKIAFTFAQIIPQCNAHAGSSGLVGWGWIGCTLTQTLELDFGVVKREKSSQSYTCI